MGKMIPAIVIDANVPYMAGKPAVLLKSEEIECANNCADFIEQVNTGKKKCRVVLDSGWRIMREYRTAATNTEPSLASVFYRKMCEYIQRSISANDYVSLSENTPDSFDPYPAEERLLNFDSSDRKYIAVAYKHAEHPIIYEGSDCKWWGIKDALIAADLSICFLCPSYIEAKYEQKIVQKGNCDCNE